MQSKSDNIRNRIEVEFNRKSEEYKQVKSGSRKDAQSQSKAPKAQLRVGAWVRTADSISNAFRSFIKSAPDVRAVYIFGQ